MKKKGIQIAFAITLVIISIIGSFWKSELLGNIIYAVVIPSFLLSIISFVAEIAEKCEETAKKCAELAGQTANTSEKLVEAKMENYKAGIYENKPYIEGLIPKTIMDEQIKTVEYYQDATALVYTQLFMFRCQKVFQRISVVGYVLLFLSLILSPYAVKLLSVIDLNCITLWSLTLLYFTLELKTDICNYLLNVVHRWFLKKGKQEEEKEE